MDKQITIRMPAELLAKWLAALRSGEYRQGIGALKTADGGFCCIGVLGMAADGDVERQSDGRPEPNPTRGWLSGHGIVFTVAGEVSQDADLPSLGCKPYNDLCATAMWANDSAGKTFAEIADAIEQCAEGT